MSNRESRVLAEELAHGLLLAAELAGDRGAARARPVLAAGLASHVADVAAVLEAHPRGARIDALRDVAAGLRRVAVGGAARLPGRARALLAAEVPREVGVGWLREAPAPRRGFVAGEGLRAVLRASAHAACDGDPAVAARELGRGRALLADALAGDTERAARSLVATLEPEEAGAVLALVQLLPSAQRLPLAPSAGTDRADDASGRHERGLVAALLAAAMRDAAPPERVRALGAMAGALESGDTRERDAQGDGRTRRWRRLARELAAVEGVPALPARAGRRV